MSRFSRHSPKILLFLLVLTMWSERAWSAPPAWKSAEKCFQEFNFRCAIKKYQQVLQQLPPQLTRQQRLSGLKKLALSYFNQGKLKQASQIYRLALELAPCTKLSGQAPNVLKHFAQTQQRWCKQSPRRCASCKCRQIICKKDCPTTRSSPPQNTRLDCQQCKRRCPSLAAASPGTPSKPSATVIAGVVLTGGALIAVGVGIGLFFSNEGVDQELRTKLVDGQLTLSQVDKANKAQAGPLGTAGQVVLISGGVILAAGITTLLVGILLPAKPKSPAISSTHFPAAPPTQKMSKSQGLEHAPLWRHSSTRPGRQWQLVYD